MPETSQIIFSHKEVAEALVKKHGIHEGIWTLILQFNIQGANVAFGSPDLMPVAMVPVIGIGLQRADRITNLSVDAAEVNPAPDKQESGEFNQGEFFR